MPVVLYGASGIHHRLLDRETSTLVEEDRFTRVGDLWVPNIRGGSNAFYQPWGSPWPGVTGAGSSGLTNFTIDTNAKGVATVMPMPVATTITKIGFKTNAVTGTPPTMRCSLQSLDSNGKPSGTVLGGGSPASATFTPSTGVQRVTLTNSYTCARGEIFAIVIDYSSGTVDGTHSSAYSYAWSLPSPRAGIPYGLTETASAWTKVGDSFPILWVQDASTVYGYPVNAPDSTTTISNSTEAGMQFTIPSAWCRTFQVVGIQALISQFATGKTYCATLYQGIAGATILQQTAALSQDVMATLGSVDRQCTIIFPTSTLVTLLSNVLYSVAISASASSIALDYMSVNAVGDWVQFPGGAQTALLTRGIIDYPPTVASAGGASIATGSRPYLDLILADVVGNGSAIFQGILS